MGDSIFGEFDGFDRFGFPAGVTRVTAGNGGEAVLFTGSEKTALLDCGMAYCAEKLIENIKKQLDGRQLDYVILSHTHYDHIGALPFIRQTWRDVKTFGAEYACKILNRQSALNMIRELSENAWKLYSGEGEFTMPEDGFVIDRKIGDGDRISLGTQEIAVIETKGHTDCSLSFVLLPQNIMFLSESTGVLGGPDKIHIAILKSYKDAMNSVEKCRNYGAKYLVSPHYGMVPEYYNGKYWELFLTTVESRKQFLDDMFRRNLSDKEIIDAYTEQFWDELRKTEQPKEAFLLNAANVIKVFKKEFDKN